MTNNDLIKITTQSFRDAGGLDVFPDLEMGETIFMSRIWPVSSNEKFDLANKVLKEKASELGYTHIFHTQYRISEKSNEFKAIGTGYKPKKK